MTVYVDNAFIPARVGRLDTRWCHLTADTKDELHAFAARIGLQRRWFQTCKRSSACKPAERCVHWHYDVTEPKRAVAVAAGAVEVDMRQIGEMCRARRAALPSQPVSLWSAGPAAGPRDARTPRRDSDA